MTQPVKELLPRSEVNKTQRILDQFADGIDEIVNHGTHIFSWYLNSHNGGDEKLPPAMLFRHILELLDSISILVRHSSIPPCKILLRGVLESSFSLEYMIEKDTTERALAFIVYSKHKKLGVYEKMDISNPKSKEFEKKLRSDKIISDIELTSFPDINMAIKNLNDLFQLPQYAPIEQEYQRLLKKRGRVSNWFQLFNENIDNVEKLASYLQHNASYEVFYRHWSGPTHGTDIIDGNLSQNIENKAEIIQIRSPRLAQEITTQTFTQAILIYNVFVAKTLPNMSVENAQWYVKSIKDMHLQLTKGAHLIKVD